MRLVLTLAVLGLAGAAGWAVHSAAPTTSSSRTKMPKAARIEARAKQQRQIEQDENGRIPHDAMMRAKAELAALPESAATAGLERTRWTESGPGNIGGRIRSMLIDPANPNTILVGSITGGIWRTTDGGQNWARTDEFLGNLTISTMVRDPNNRLVMYAGTGEEAQSHRGAGIWKSTDGGSTWARLASTNLPDFYFVWRLSISANGSTLLAALGGGKGLRRSTNGGATWVTVRSPANTSGVYWDVRFHPTKSNVAVASYGDFDFGASTNVSTVAYSTDGGATWMDSTSAIRSTNANKTERIELAWHAGYGGTGNGCVYALQDRGNSTMFRSIDGGVTWTQTATATGILGTQGDYDNTIWVDPSDTDANVANDTVLAGGLDLHRSGDGGQTFTVISSWQQPTSAHADQHGIFGHPGFNGTSNKTVYFTNDGGVYRHDDIYAAAPTTGWVNLNNSLAITQFYGVSRHAGSDTLYGGTQDNGMLSTNPTKGFNGWNQPVGGDGGYAASDPTDGRYHYGEYIYGQVSRSDDSGGSGDDIWGSGFGAPYEILEASQSKGNFIAPFILDPNNPQRLLVGLASLWRTNDSRTVVNHTNQTGPRWAVIKTPNTGDGPISAITVADGDSQKIWIGHNGGEVYYTANGTSVSPTWVRRDTGLPSRYVTRIVVDSMNHNHVYVMFGGYSADNIWESTNGGVNWIAITTPRAPVRDLEIHPTKRNWLYAATQVGLIVSENGGQVWTSGPSFSDVAIFETFFSGDRLYLGTHGRGVAWQKPLGASVISKGATCQLGTGMPGGPALSSTLPVIGQTMTFTLASAPTAAALFVGPEQVPPFKFLGCDIYIQPASLFGAGNFSGTTASLPIPNDTSLIGKQIAFLGAAIVGGQSYATNGLIAEFGN